MPSFQIALSPHKRAAGRFVLSVRRTLQRAFLEEQQKSGLTQSAVAREIGVHRSVINRELRGDKDITMGRVAELAYLLGRKAILSFPERAQKEGANALPAIPEVTASESGSFKLVGFEEPVPSGQTASAEVFGFVITGKKLEAA